MPPPVICQKKGSDKSPIHPARPGLSHGRNRVTGSADTFLGFTDVKLAESAWLAEAFPFAQNVGVIAIAVCKLGEVMCRDRGSAYDQAAFVAGDSFTHCASSAAMSMNTPPAITA